MDAPAHIIISGPKATLGREFNTVKNGSYTLAINLFHHNIDAIKRLKIVEIIKEISTS
jgi:hypothetical protein